MVIVRSDGVRPPRRPGLWPALGAAGLLVVVLGAFGLLGGGTVTGDPLDPVDPEAPVQRPPPPRSSAALASGPSHDRPVVSDILADGMLTVIDLGGAGGSPTILRWDSDDGLPTRSELPEGSGRWALNSSGEAIAYTTSVEAGRGSLVVRYADGSERTLADEVLTFAWKQGEPDRIAWTVPAPEGVRLMTASIPPDGADGRVDAHVVGDVEPGVVAGWNSRGIWVERFDGDTGESSFHAYAITGRTVALHRGDLIAFHPDGERLLIGRRFGGQWMLFEAGRGLAFERIEWSLDGAEVVGGAWSHSEPDRIVLFGFDVDSSQWWVRVWDTAANGATHRLDVPHRVLDVGWSPADRFMVVTVSDDRGRTAVLAVDAGSLIAHEVVFDDVALAAMVPIPGAVVAVPEVTGFPLERAVTVLADTGFGAVVDDAFASRGLAVTQSPAPGVLMPAGSGVRIGVGRPRASERLNEVYADVPEGNAECAPASPVSPAVEAGVSGVAMTEIRGSGDFELWGLLLTPMPLRTDWPFKMVVRVDADAPDPIFLARHPARRVTYSRWGPFMHDEGSGWDRPGTEWSIAFVLREPGCWTLRVVVGLEVSDFYVRVW